MSRSKLKHIHSEYCLVVYCSSWLHIQIVSSFVHETLPANAMLTEVVQFREYETHCICHTSQTFNHLHRLGSRLDSKFSIVYGDRNSCCITFFPLVN